MLDIDKMFLFIAKLIKNIDNNEVNSINEEYESTIYASTYQQVKELYLEYDSIRVIHILLNSQLVLHMDRVDIYSIILFTNLLCYVFENKWEDIYELAKLYVSEEIREKMNNIFNIWGYIHDNIQI